MIEHLEPKILRSIAMPVQLYQRLRRYAITNQYNIELAITGFLGRFLNESVIISKEDKEYAMRLEDCTFISIYLSERLDEQINSLAHDLGMMRRVLVCMILDKSLKKPEN